jgi:hypothetical protein
MLLSLALGASACGSDVVTTPTTPTPTTVTETFSGTLTQNGGVTHGFTAATAGTITASVTTISPDSTVVIGFSLGTLSANACQISLANDRATQGTVVVGTLGAAGILCVRIYDVGNLVQPESYEIQVIHP